MGQDQQHGLGAEEQDLVLLACEFGISLKRLPGLPESVHMVSRHEPAWA